MRSPPPGSPMLAIHLSRSDRLLLWAIRAWVIGMKRRVDVVEPLRAAFERFQIGDAVELLDALMSIVACGAIRTLAVECVCSETLGGDERRLLEAAALHQAGRGFEARFILREMLTPTASRDAGEILDRLGAALTAAAHRLSTWTGDTERFVFDTVSDGSIATMRPTLH